MLDKLTIEDFSPHIDQVFRIQVNETSQLEVELTEVSALGQAPNTDTGEKIRRPFSVVFRGPLESYLPQMIYAVHHHKLGRLDLFLVPVGPDRKGMCYQAIFA